MVGTCIESCYIMTGFVYTIVNKYQVWRGAASISRADLTCLQLEACDGCMMTVYRMMKARILNMSVSRASVLFLCPILCHAE